MLKCQGRIQGGAKGAMAPPPPPPQGGGVPRGGGRGAGGGGGQGEVYDPYKNYP